MDRKTTILLAVALLAGVAAAQQVPQPYAGQQERQIKALSAGEIDDYLAGNGMGLARAAELNGYPGPRHVLDLSGQLGLSAAQRSRTESLFRAMREEARDIGRALVDSERELDQLFATGEVTQEAMSRKLHDIGELQARLRTVHLKAHLDQARVLTPAQNARYAQLRGYADGHDEHAGHQAH